MTSGVTKQEVNPGLADAESVRNTVSVGCSLVRAALGWCSVTTHVPDF